MPYSSQRSLGQVPGAGVVPGGLVVVISVTAMQNKKDIRFIPFARLVLSFDFHSFAARLYSRVHVIRKRLSRSGLISSKICRFFELTAVDCIWCEILCKTFF